VRFGAMTPRWVALGTAALVVVVDQLTKLWAVWALESAPMVLIDGFLQFRLVRNPGGAFSILPGAGSIIALAAIVAVVAIVLTAGRIPFVPEAVGLGLVLGGAVGNLADRIFRGDGWLDGRVVDFVDFDFFPTFNAADSAITIGAGIVLLMAFLRR
jgi:signal peptidase II